MKSPALTPILSLVLAFFITATSAVFGEFVEPTQGQLDTAAASPDDLVDLLKDADTDEIISVLTAVLKRIENSLFPETIRNRLIRSTAAAVALSGDDKAKVAVAAMGAVSDEYKPTVAAAAVLVSGRQAKDAQLALIDAAGANAAKITQAVQYPVDLVLGRELAEYATTAARSAVRQTSSAIEFTMNLETLPLAKEDAIKGSRIARNEADLRNEARILSLFPGISDNDLRLLLRLDSNELEEFLGASDRRMDQILLNLRSNIDDTEPTKERFVTRQELEDELAKYIPRAEIYFGQAIYDHHTRQYLRPLYVLSPNGAPRDLYDQEFFRTIGLIP